MTASVSARVLISRPRPLFRRELLISPAHPGGERVLVREFPPETTTEGDIKLAESARERYFAGTLLAVGDQAADKLYDLGYELGDEVWYGKYAGLIQEWQHIVGRDSNDCPHEGAWDFVPRDKLARWLEVGAPNDNITLRECRACKTLKVAERVIVMSVDDICLNVDVERRLEAGELVRRRGVTSDGRTRYYIERRHDRPDSFEIERSR